MSLLRGSALEEVRLRKADGDVVTDLFDYLKDAFGDKCSASQLLQDFYNCKQNQGEDIHSFSHAFSQAHSCVLKQHPNSISNKKVVLRDQFVEGVRDFTLRTQNIYAGETSFYFHRGTVLEPELVTAGVECIQLNQIRAADVDKFDSHFKKATSTLPGYSKKELQTFQCQDPLNNVF